MKYRITFNEKTKKYGIEEQRRFFWRKYWSPCQRLLLFADDFVPIELDSKEEAEKVIEYWLKEEKITVIKEYST